MENKKTYAFVLLLLFGALSFQWMSHFNEIIYELPPLHISTPQNSKEHLKTTRQFISIAHFDLFGTAITAQELDNLKRLYESTGDKKMFEKLLLRNLLNKPNITIPTTQKMHLDIPLFIKKTYLQLFNRLPNALELWQLNEAIAHDSILTPKLVYFALMTSDEYRKY